MDGAGIVCVRSCSGRPCDPASGSLRCRRGVTHAAPRDARRFVRPLPHPGRFAAGGLWAPASPGHGVAAHRALTTADEGGLRRHGERPRTAPTSTSAPGWTMPVRLRRLGRASAPLLAAIEEGCSIRLARVRRGRDRAGGSRMSAARSKHRRIERPVAAGPSSRRGKPGARTRRRGLRRLRGAGGERPFRPAGATRGGDSSSRPAPPGARGRSRPSAPGPSVVSRGRIPVGRSDAGGSRAFAPKARTPGLAAARHGHRGPSRSHPDRPAPLPRAGGRSTPGQAPGMTAPLNVAVTHSFSAGSA